MKKLVPYLNLSLFCIISVLVSGCGGEFTGNSQRGTVSESAVSGEAVSGRAVSGEAVRPEGTEKQDKKNESANTSLESHQFCSANCLYMADCENDELIQYCVKTNKKKIYHIKGQLLGLLLVERDRIYYTKSLWDGELEEEEDKYRIYSIPLVSDEDGSETPILEKEECLEDIPELSYDSYPQMDGDSIYYIPYGSRGMWRYDRKQKKGEIVPLEYCTGVQTLKEKTILYGHEDDRDTIGVWDIKTDKMIHIPLPEMDEDDRDSETLADDGLYYSSYTNGDPVWGEVNRVDFSTQEMKVFVTEREIKNVLSEKAGMKKNSLKGCEVDLKAVGNRLYLILFLEWTEGTCWNAQDVILSRELGTEGELQYEEELTECIRKYGKKRGEPKKFDDYTFGIHAGETEGIEELCYNAASFAAIEEERAYLNPDTYQYLEPEDEKYFLLFDRKTGKSKLIEEGMPEYYEYYYDRVWKEDFDDGF